MSKSSYAKRLLVGSVGAVVMTFALGILVMWMNGALVEEDPSTIALTPCVFGDQTSTKVDNPFEKQTITLDCISPEAEKPLVAQWFDRILSRRASENSANGAAGG